MYNGVWSQDKKTTPEWLRCVCLPCASSDQNLPVVPAAVDEHVPRHAVVPRAAEAVLSVALHGRGFVPLHRQTVMGHLQLPVG